MNGFALGLGLKRRLTATQKKAIGERDGVCVGLREGNFFFLIGANFILRSPTVRRVRIQYKHKRDLGTRLDWAKSKE